MTTPRNLAEARIERRTYYDGLTGLPNPVLFSRRAAAAIDEARSRRRGLAVLALDLDRFSSINASLGHAAGDELLRRLAPRLIRTIGIRDTVCRAEADRFLVLLSDAPDSAAASRAASRLMFAISRPLLLLGGREIAVSAGVGAALFPDHASTEALLLARANAALAEAKLDGPCSLRIFGESDRLRASA